ncbi:hypothetical protein FQN52_003923 [Onygenales sp. PD_12]|nr:hypothetical protein FQN52_003923 [Onygenales sp. PD_12]
MKLNTICIAMMAALVTYAQALPRYEGEEALVEAVAEALVMEDQAMFEDQTFPEIGDDAQRRCVGPCYPRRPSRCPRGYVLEVLQMIPLLPTGGEYLAINHDVKEEHWE